MDLINEQTWDVFKENEKRVKIYLGDSFSNIRDTIGLND